MSLLMQIAERALNRPLMIHPDKLPIILGVLEGRLPIEATPKWLAAAKSAAADLPEAAQATMFGPNPTASRFVGSQTDEDPVSGRRVTLPYRRTREGTAVIPVIGSLINRGPWLGSYSGETSYEGLKFQIGHAADDPRTTAILLDIDSPGGEAVGCFECAALIRQASTKKPVAAMVNGMAASAAYALASAANKIVVSETSVAGSIGVVMLHGDYSRKLDKEGITPTLIFAGAHKVDGHPFAPLPAGVKSDLQAEVDRFYSIFVQSVAQGRDRMTEKSIRATEARVYIGGDAVDIGLADELGTFETALADLNRAQVGQSTTKRRLSMSVDKSAPDANSGLTNKEVDAKVAAAKAEAAATAKAEATAEAAAKAKADIDTAAAAAKAEGAKEGAKAERERIKAITSLDEAKGREGAALSLALSGELSVDAAKTTLASLPKSAVAAGQRSAEAPLGLTIDSDSVLLSGATAGRMTPDEVAASINKQFGAKK